MVHDIKKYNDKHIVLDLIDTNQSNDVSTFLILNNKMFITINKDFNVDSADGYLYIEECKDSENAHLIKLDEIACVFTHSEYVDSYLKNIL